MYILFMMMSLSVLEDVYKFGSYPHNNHPQMKTLDWSVETLGHEQ